jgi:hypothetical protein
MCKPEANEETRISMRQDAHVGRINAAWRWPSTAKAAHGGRKAAGRARELSKK